MTMDASHLIVDDRLNVAKLRPIQDLVLVEEIDRTKTSGGIFLAETGNRGTECRMARVIAVGNGIACAKAAFFFPIELSPGDVVLTIEYAAEKLRIPGGRYRFVRSSFIWGRVKLKSDATYEIERLEPRFDSYLVLPERELTTASGAIFIANENKREDQLRIATVKEVGPGRWDSERSSAENMIRQPIQFGVGDRVLMTRYAGAEVEVRGEWMRLIQEFDVKSGYCSEEIHG